jgi:hypothetical protein
MVKLNWNQIKMLKPPFSGDNKTNRYILISDDGKRIIINLDMINKEIYFLNDITKINKGENIVDYKQTELTKTDKKKKKIFMKVSCIIFLKLIITLCVSSFVTLFLGKALSKVLVRFDVRFLAMGVFSIVFFFVWKILEKIKME